MRENFDPNIFATSYLANGNNNIIPGINDIVRLMLVVGGVVDCGHGIIFKKYGCNGVGDFGDGWKCWQWGL